MDDLVGKEILGCALRLWLEFDVLGKQRTVAGLNLLRGRCCQNRPDREINRPSHC